MNKIEEFLKRNRRRNAHLYDPSAKEGLDYIICPVTGARKIMLESKYITRILQISLEDFNRQFPDIKRIATNRINKVKQGLQQIDKKTGLTKHQLAVLKTQAKLNQVDPVTGLTFHKLRTQKTKNTHMNNIDCYGRNGYSQLAARAIINGNKTKAQKGLILAPELRNEFYRYKTIILYLTAKLRPEVVNGYKTGLAGTPGAYQIDHIYSIMHGYVNKVSPLVIGHRANLRMISWEDNLRKHSTSSINLSHLLHLVGYSEDQSRYEFDITINIIGKDIDNSITPNGAFLYERLNSAIIR